MNSETISDQVARFVMTCNNEVLKKITVSSIASRFQVDRSHLAREFKSDKNFTLCQFIQKEKMVRAAILLREATDLTVARLSENLGFCSAEYFREVFKKYFGVAPSKYREYKNHFKKDSWSVYHSIEGADWSNNE
jgi:two-component system response regulator YesN